MSIDPSRTVAELVLEQPSRSRVFERLGPKPDWTHVPIALVNGVVASSENMVALGAAVLAASAAAARAGALVTLRSSVPAVRVRLSPPLSPDVS